MKVSVIGVGALVLCTSVAVHAAESGESSPAAAATRFLTALQQQDFRKAAAMFAAEDTSVSPATERALERIGEHLGGFSSMHPIPKLPEGRSIKLEVPARKPAAFTRQSFVQLCYASTASDGTPVFYALNLAPANTLPQVLSFDVHFPASSAQSAKRANELVRLIWP